MRRRGRNGPGGRSPGRARMGHRPPGPLQCGYGRRRQRAPGATAAARALGHPAPLLRRPRAAPRRDAGLLRPRLADPVRVPRGPARERHRTPGGELGAAARPQPRPARHERQGPRAVRARPGVERHRDRPDRRRRAAVVVARVPLRARVGAERDLRPAQPRLPAPEARRPRPPGHRADRAAARPHDRGHEPDRALGDRAPALAPGRLAHRRRPRDQLADDVPVPPARVPHAAQHRAHDAAGAAGRADRDRAPAADVRVAAAVRALGRGPARPEGLRRRLACCSCGSTSWATWCCSEGPSRGGRRAGARRRPRPPPSLRCPRARGCRARRPGCASRRAASARRAARSGPSAASARAARRSRP